MPAATLALSVAQVSSAVSAQGEADGTRTVAALSRELGEAVWPYAAGVLVAIPLIAFSIWHLLARARLGSRLATAIWALALIVLAPYSLPISWYAHVWSAPVTEPAPVRG